MTPARTAFAAAVAARAPEVAAITRRLVAVPSPNPPGDVRACAQDCAALLRELAPAAEVSLHATSPEVTNVVARIAGAGPGRTLAFNGHLDTYPVNEALPWTVAPLGGEVRDGRIHGRGTADMKGGIAASVLAFALLAEHRAAWRGEAILTLAGDEETMGPLGTKWLLDNVPGLAQAQAVIIGDAGSPRVLRFGEKGFLWIEVEATGTAAHGAHVHLGQNAIDRLRAALDVVAGLRALPVAAPPAVTAAIAAARADQRTARRRRRGRGAGQRHRQYRADQRRHRAQPGARDRARRLRHPPAGGRGRAQVERRSPPGWTLCPACPGACCAASNPTTPTRPPTSSAWRTPPPRSAGRPRRGEHARGRIGRPLVPHGRPADHRLRPDPHNMGGADEWADLAELEAVARVHALAAFDFLAG